MDSILIVDDEQDNVDALHRLLRNEYEIASSTSPFDALKMIQNQNFSVIVSDQRMPSMTGVDLLEKAKQIRPHTTRILLTGYTDIDAVIEAINRGHVYRYVAKPWEPGELRATLKQACEAFHLRSELEQKNRALELKNVELANAFDELTVLDRAKGRFLSLVSHELNTPLTVLNSFITLLEEERKNLPSDLQKAVSKLSGASDRLTEIVQDVLTYVKLEAHSKLRLESVDWVKLNQEVIADLAGKAKEKGVSFQFQGPKNAILNADPEKMKIAVRCLLSDSLTRSPSGEAVKVKLEEAPSGGWVYSVLSKGEPLNQDALKPLETGASEMHHSQHLGLSLAICRTVIDAHKGNMQIVPAGGTGNLIRITLQ